MPANITTIIAGGPMTLGMQLPMALLPGALVALTATQGGPPATSYEQRYGEVIALEPRGDRIAQVNQFVLKRDVAQFTLASGTVYLLSSVGDRTVGAVFRGRGTFSFSPPTPIEQDRLARFQKVRSLEVSLTELVLLFADTTLAELEGKLTFQPGDVPGDVRSLVKRSLDYLGDEDSKSLDPDLMASFLNGESNDLFYAHVNRDGGGPLMFMLNPFESEGVTLSSRAPRLAWTRRPEVICRFPAAGAFRRSRRHDRAPGRRDDPRLSARGHARPDGHGQLELRRPRAARDHHRGPRRAVGRPRSLPKAPRGFGAVG